MIVQLEGNKKSVGVRIGGKDLKFERKRMDQLNIVICTPGRLLQHMDENSSFVTSNLQVSFNTLCVFNSCFISSLI